MAPTTSDIAKTARDLGNGFLALQLAWLALLDPSVPLLRVWKELGRQDPMSPFHVIRNDGTKHSSRPISEILIEAASTPGAGMGGDLLKFPAMYGGVRVADDLKSAGILPAPTEPLLEFARHFRNACAHGNRWHFVGNQPQNPAELRGLTLDASMHGSEALFKWVGPGDYLDYLDDLVDFLTLRSP